MDIHSRLISDRPEDRRAQEHLRRNWGTIEKLANTLSGGKYAADKAQKAAPAPQAQGLIIVDQAAPRAPDVPQPYLRISMNGRVVVADCGTGVQLQFLGQIKRVNGALRFTLATADNGFISPVDAETAERLADVADRTIGRGYTEADLTRDIKTKLQIA